MFRSRPLVSIPLVVESPLATSQAQPVTVGLPFPQGLLDQTSCLTLFEPDGAAIPLQSRPLAHWPDGSVKWALLDFMIGPIAAREVCRTLTIQSGLDQEAVLGHERIRIEETASTIIVDTGTARFHLDRLRFGPFIQVEIQGKNLLDETRSSTLLTDDAERRRSPRIERARVEEQGAVRATIHFTGAFRGGTETLPV